MNIFLFSRIRKNSCISTFEAVHDFQTIPNNKILLFINKTIVPKEKPKYRESEQSRDKMAMTAMPLFDRYRSGTMIRWSTPLLTPLPLFSHVHRNGKKVYCLYSVVWIFELTDVYKSWMSGIMLTR